MWGYEILRDYDAVEHTRIMENKKVTYSSKYFLITMRQTLCTRFTFADALRVSILLT